MATVTLTPDNGTVSAHPDRCHAARNEKVRWNVPGAQSFVLLFKNGETPFDSATVPNEPDGDFAERTVRDAADVVDGAAYPYQVKGVDAHGQPFEDLSCPSIIIS